jgi:hypothetical protein
LPISKLFVAILICLEEKNTFFYSSMTVPLSDPTSDDFCQFTFAEALSLFFATLKKLILTRTAHHQYEREHEIEN